MVYLVKFLHPEVNYWICNFLYEAEILLCHISKLCLLSPSEECWFYSSVLLCWNGVSSCMDFLTDKHNCVQQRSGFKFYFLKHSFAPRWLNTALGHRWLVACLMSRINDPTCIRGVVIKAMMIGGLLLGWDTVCPLWEKRFLVTLHLTHLLLPLCHLLLFGRY